MQTWFLSQQPTVYPLRCVEKHQGTPGTFTFVPGVGGACASWPADLHNCVVQRSELAASPLPLGLGSSLPE